MPILDDLEDLLSEQTPCPLCRGERKVRSSEWLHHEEALAADERSLAGLKMVRPEQFDSEKKVKPPVGPEFVICSRCRGLGQVTALLDRNDLQVALLRVVREMKKLRP